MEHTDLIVIGAGPGGMQAAITAANSGIQVTLIDSNSLPGGQYYKQIPQQFSNNDQTTNQKEAIKLIQNLDHPAIKFLSKTLVWGIFHNPKTNLWQTTLQGDNCPERLEAPAIIIAAGAYDRSIPFPGWDLPGVITAGAAQIMVKSQGILPGKRILISGTGPLQLAAASHLAEAGAEVVGVLECNKSILRKGVPYISSIWGQWKRIQEGIEYAGVLLKAGVSYRTGWSVIKAEGVGKVQQAIIAKLDSNGVPIQGTEKKYEVDSIVLGYGLTPSTEFFRLLNCDMTYSSAEGVFLPKRDPFFQTSLSGIYAVGDCAGIGGAKLAMLEGKIAANHAATKIKTTNKDLDVQISQIDKAGFKRERGFAKLLGDVFSIPKGLFSLAESETIICRCEQITLSEVKDAISCGAQSVTDIKNITRSGMGNCQGRTCGSIMAQILAIQSKRSPEESHYLNIRPPVHPVQIKFIDADINEVKR